MPARDIVQSVVDEVSPPAHPRDPVVEHMDRLTKPQGSLGALEELAVQLATIYGDPPGPFVYPTVFVLAADHGVAVRGVSAYPAEVTAQMCANFSAGGAAINALARNAGAEVVVVDMGVAADLAGLAGIEHRKVRGGTDDLAEGPAMGVEEAWRAIASGIEVFRSRGGHADLVAVGEMGIGNTTAASAITASVTERDASLLVGPGTGLDEAGLARKREVVVEAVRRTRTLSDPVEILAAVGGFEIAGMVGVILGAAAANRAVVIDGFISTAAALLAVQMCPDCRRFLVASHRSPEPGHAIALDHLDLRPLLDLGLRLGEGSGAALAIPIVSAAAAILREMATFASAGVSKIDAAVP